jgi:hypothetical protein
MFSTEISEPLDMPAGCEIFPLDNFWNTPVNGLPRHESSAAFLEVMGLDVPLHADFGKTAGIPYTILRRPVQAADVAFGSHESDAGPYFIPE